MKTSNKLLIGLAALFFIVPLSAMIYDSKNYVDAKDFKFEQPAVKTFDQELKNNFAQPLNTFTSIKIADGKGMHFSFSFIKDVKYGVKMRDKLKGLLEFKNGANGTLEISVVGTPQQNQTVHVLIYAPDLNKVSIANAERLNVDGSMTALEIEASGSKTLVLSDLTMDKLVINTSKVESVELWGLKLNRLEATLAETDLNCNNSAYQSVMLKTSGKSNLTFGDDDKETKESLGLVSLTTLGTGKVQFGQNVQLETINGSLSDATEVDMPVKYLKHLLNQ